MRALLAGLPPESQVVAIDNPGAASYSVTNEYLAAIIEVLDGTSWRAVMPHAKRGWKPPKPIEVPRPWLTGPRRPGAPKVRRRPTADETRRLLNRNVRGGER